MKKGINLDDDDVLYREPMMVDFRAPDLQKEIIRALKSSYMHFNHGSY